VRTHCVVFLDVALSIPHFPFLMMPEPRHTFPRAMRLSGKLAFAAVYAPKVKVSRWPVVVYSRPNGLGHLRLGLSVPRAVGIAVRRNRIKRLLREAFRLDASNRQNGLDLVVVVRPHEPKTLAQYQLLLEETIKASVATWARRATQE
jgi:ribonuclease P protein component